MEKGKFIRVIPIEKVVEPSGTYVKCKALVDSDETLWDFSEFAKDFGIGVEIVKNPDSKTFSFNSSRWNKCAWKPKGPQPNWISQEINNN